MDNATIRAAFAAQMMGAWGRVGLPGAVFESFQNSLAVDASASANAVYDAARTGYGPGRTGASTCLADHFDNLSGWANSSSGGTVSIATVVEADTMISGNVMSFDTGGALGSVSRVQRTISGIPASFGVGTILKLVQVGAAGADALRFEITNQDNSCLSLRFRDGSMEFFQDGAWREAMAHGGNYWTEWWADAESLGDGRHEVRIYAGTELVYTRSGTLPGGAKAGQCVIWQASGSANYRKSMVTSLDIGSRQASPGMMLSSASWPIAFAPAAGKIAVLVEDVSASLDPNVSLLAHASRDAGQTWTQVPLVLCDDFSSGEVDPTKPVKMLIGDFSFASATGANLRWKLDVSAGHWPFIQGVALCW